MINGCRFLYDRFVAGGYDLYMPVQAPGSNSAAPGLLASVLLSLAPQPRFQGGLSIAPHAALLGLRRRQRGCLH